MKLGQFQVYTGDGKGKTTAALGLLLRACGAGYNCVFAQFLKNGDSSECAAMEKLGMVIRVAPEIRFPFTWNMTAQQKSEIAAEHDRILQAAFAACGDGEKTLLVLDECAGAYGYGLLDRELLLQLLRTKPEALEVVMTGNGADDALLELTDYVSHVTKVKHPFDCGISARRGIEM